MTSTFKIKQTSKNWTSGSFLICLQTSRACFHFGGKAGATQPCPALPHPRPFTPQPVGDEEGRQRTGLKPLGREKMEFLERTQRGQAESQEDRRNETHYEFKGQKAKLPRPGEGASETVPGQGLWPHYLRTGRKRPPRKWTWRMRGH